MRIKQHLIVGGIIALALATSAGCGSSGSSESAKSDPGSATTVPGSESAPDSSTAKAGSDPGSCSGTAATITDTKREESAKLDHAGGVSSSDGAEYTVYLADSEINPDDLSAEEAPVPVPGHHVVTVSIKVFDPTETPQPIKAGTKIPFTLDFGVLTFRVADNTDEGSSDTTVDAKGDVEVTEVGDSLCFSIDYSSDERTLTGTVEAPVKKL